jgi:hypothetical protein
MDDAPLPRLAAVVFADGDTADAALAEAVATLNRDGLAVGGLLQASGPPVSDGKREMQVLVLQTGTWIRLDQPLGRHSQSCALDGDALARAAAALRGAIAERPAVVLVSRFGKQEAQGGGLRAETAEAILSGIPTLIPVHVELLADLERFLGGPVRTLEPTADAIVAWARAFGA